MNERESSLGFEIIYQDTSRSLGTRIIGIRKVRCPRCGKTFKQSGSGGCFSMMWIPMNCPGGCGFPWPEREIDGNEKDMG